jgi:hypothetical protein
VWIYERAVDFDELRRFHQNLGYGLYGRRIERSSLPFGQHRWVSFSGPQPDIQFEECARPRAELSEWADERALLPIDPERGPGWHLGVIPLTDGSTAISVVASHYLADGVGGLLTVADAARGDMRDLGYPPPRSGTRLRAVVSDLRQTAQGAPEVARALGAAGKLALRRRHDIARSAAPRSTAMVGDDGDHNVVEPVVTLFIDLEDWDARAEALGGNGHTLVAGFAARIAERMGRLRASDGAATLIIAINERTLDDTRANAQSYAIVSVDPTRVTTDLSGARAAIREARKTAREVPDETLQLLPLIPFVPKRAVRRAADVTLGFTADLPVFCSILGDVDPVLGRPDGTDADYVILRGLDRQVTREVLEQRRGLLSVTSGRLGGKISITVLAYQPGRKNSKRHLRELTAKTLAEFDLAAVIV